MVPLSPVGHRLVKPINSNLLVAVTYTAVAGLDTHIDCTVEFLNTAPSAPTTPPHTAAPPDGDSWLRSLWGQQKEPLVPTTAADMPVLLGNVQMVGYVRLNHNISGASIADGGADLLWKNSDYIDKYTLAAGAEGAGAVLQTRFFRDRGGPKPKMGKLGGFPGGISGGTSGGTSGGPLGGAFGGAAARLDSTAVYLMHDLLFGFNTMEMPLAHAPPPSEYQRLVTAEILADNVVPFYVTSQHLLFSSVRLAAGHGQRYTVRVERPSEAFPPSYNMKLTGCVGDAGLVSIGYSFVVGLLEGGEGGVTQRGVFFPLEFRPAKKQWGREWRQHNYLEECGVRHAWCSDVAAEGSSDGAPNSADSGPTSAAGAPKSAAGAPNSADSGPNSAAGAPNSADGGPNSADSGPNSAAGAPNSADGGPNSADSGPNSADGAPNSADGGPNSADGARARTKFLEGLDALVAPGARAAPRSRKCSASLPGAVDQMPARLKVLYQIRVNNHGLCNLTLLKPFFSVGDDISLILEPALLAGPTRVVGATSHIEAHELFHLDGGRTHVNIYKVTPTHKCNMYAGALARDVDGGALMCINVPLHLCQQFQASSLMDLKYFVVCRFILNDVGDIGADIGGDIGADIGAAADTAAQLSVADPLLEHYFERVQPYEAECESTVFKFLVPLTISA